jgi:hypothetical protein
MNIGTSIHQRNMIVVDRHRRRIHNQQCTRSTANISMRSMPDRVISIQKIVNFTMPARLFTHFAPVLAASSCHMTAHASSLPNDEMAKAKDVRRSIYTQNNASYLKVLT